MIMKLAFTSKYAEVFITFGIKILSQPAGLDVSQYFLKCKQVKPSTRVAETLQVPISNSVRV